MIINKKIIIGVLMAVILIFGLIIGWAVFQKGKVPPEEIKKEGTITETERQLRELEELREGTQPSTEEEIKGQTEDLEKLRREAKSLPEEEIQKQLEELEKLH